MRQSRGVRLLAVVGLAALLLFVCAAAPRTAAGQTAPGADLHGGDLLYVGGYLGTVDGAGGVSDFDLGAAGIEIDVGLGSHAAALTGSPNRVRPGAP